jgi:hypothetical protein
MTTRPPGFDEGDPDAATNGIYGVNGHPDENVQPPWLPATRPASQPPGAGPAGHDERARHVPLGELDEPRRGRPPGTGPWPAPVAQSPVAQGQPPVMRPASQPPGAGVAGRNNGRAGYAPLDEPRRGRPPGTGPWPAPVAQSPVAQGQPPVMRPASQPPGAGVAGRNNGRAGYAPLDEPRRGRPPGTSPSSAPASQERPPATRPAGQPPGAGPLGELDEPRRGRPPGTGPSSAPASQPLPPNARVSHKGRPKQPRSARPLPPPLDDVDGYDLRPNPLGAKTVPDLMECVRQYYIWAGKRGLRVMARHIDQQLSAQTLSNLLKSDHLPGRLDQMRLLIEACGGNAEDQQRFVTAWRRFTMG